MQEEKKSHGKADACRGFLTKYCAKRGFLKQFLSYGTSPLGCLFVLLPGGVFFAVKHHSVPAEEREIRREAVGVSANDCSRFPRLRKKSGRKRANRGPYSEIVRFLLTAAAFPLS